MKTNAKTEGFRLAKPTIKKLRKQYLCLCLCLWLGYWFWFLTKTKTNNHLLETLTNKQRLSFLVLLSGAKSPLRFSKPRFSVFNAFSTKFYTFGKIGDLTMPVHYDNNVKTKPCPKCGKERPLDWFANEGEPCWKCKNLAWKDKQTPEDGLLGSIRKRSHGKHAKGANDDLIG